jgi:hypothetical protein
LLQISEDRFWPSTNAAVSWVWLHGQPRDTSTTSGSFVRGSLRSPTFSIFTASHFKATKNPQSMNARPRCVSVLFGSATMSTIILYDLPSRDPLHSWSLNPWKSMRHSVPTDPSQMLTLCTARLILNYKNIEYVTMWTEYPEIAPTFKNVYVCSNNYI